MSVQNPAAARRSSKSSGGSRSCSVAHRHKRSPISSACRIPVIPQNGEAAKISYLHNAAGQRVFKSEPQTAQTLPNETELGTPFVDWLKRNFQWLYATAQTNATLGTSYSYGEGQLPSWAMLGEYGNGGATSTGRTEYIWLPQDDGSAIPIAMFRGNRYFNIHSDHLGTPRLITDDTAKPTWQWSYSAFGDNKPTGILKATTNPNTAITSAPLLNATSPATVLNLRFPGPYADSETGHLYNYFRTYMPNQDRYTQNDPKGLEAGFNRYVYADANALAIIDPMGLMGQGSGGGKSAPNNSPIKGTPSGYGRIISDLEQTRRDGHRDFPGEVNSEMRHCVASCLTAGQHGTGLARTAGAVNELQGLILWDIPNLVSRVRGDTPWAFQLEDLASNERGFACSRNQSCTPDPSLSKRDSCIKCCSGK